MPNGFGVCIVAGSFGTVECLSCRVSKRSHLIVHLIGLGLRRNLGSLSWCRIYGIPLSFYVCLTALAQCDGQFYMLSNPSCGARVRVVFASF